MLPSAAAAWFGFRAGSKAPSGPSGHTVNSEPRIKEALALPTDSTEGPNLPSSAPEQGEPAVALQQGPPLALQQASVTDETQPKRDGADLSPNTSAEDITAETKNTVGPQKKPKALRSMTPLGRAPRRIRNAGDAWVDVPKKVVVKHLERPLPKETHLAARTQNLGLPTNKDWNPPPRAPKTNGPKSRNCWVREPWPLNLAGSKRRNLPSKPP